LIISHSPEVAVSAFEMNFQIIIGRSHGGITRFITWDNLGSNNPLSKQKLKKLILNYNAELLFADKLIAIEGDSERILLNSIMRKINPTLLSEKIAIIPVGTNFKGFKDSLADLLFDKILLITDIDFSEKDTEDNNIYSTNKNIQLLFSSNLDTTIKDHPLNKTLKQEKSFLTKEWNLMPNGNLTNSDNDSISSNFKIVTEGYSNEFKFWPRTLESAMVTASHQNFDLYKKNELLRNDVKVSLDKNPYLLNDIEGKLLRSTVKKADFALNTLDFINNKTFRIPQYLKKGLEWFGNND
jgi:predicted ATP-dependent endonuclease of OLD family